MKQRIHGALAALVEPEPNMGALRLALAGCVLDIPALEQAGFFQSCSCIDYDVWETSDCFCYSERETSPVLIRVWTSRMGHMRDVRMYRQQPGEFASRVRCETFGDVVPELLSALQSCVKAPFETRPEEEWQLLTEKRCLTNDREEYSQPERHARLLEAIIREVYCDDQALAARALIGATRFREYCPLPWTLASMAGEAAKIGLYYEGRLLIEEVLRRGEPDDGLWNSLGCFFHYAENRLVALHCFLEALRLVPDSKQYSDNAWLEARKILPGMLQTHAFVEILGLAETLMKQAFTAKEEDRAATLCILGLCYEDRGDTDDARLYYTEALKADASFKPAEASLKRLGWSSPENRRDMLLRLTESFPYLPEQKPGPELVPTQFVAGDDLGGRWRSVTPDMENFIPGHLAKIMEEGKFLQACSLPLTSMSDTEGAELTFFELALDEHIRTVSISEVAPEAKHLDFLTAFPVGMNGPVNRLCIEGFFEWSGNYEGYFSTTTSGGRELVFLNPFYPRDKQAASQPGIYEFQLFGFVTWIEEGEDKRFEITEGPLIEQRRADAIKENPGCDPESITSVTVHVDSTCSFLSPIPEDDTQPDFHTFRCTVERARWFEFEGTPMCRMETVFNMGNGEEHRLRATLFAGEHILKGLEPAPGMVIEGGLWLQGFLHSPKPIELKERDEEIQYPSISELLDNSYLPPWKGMVTLSEEQNRALRAVYWTLFHHPVRQIDFVQDAIAVEPEMVLTLINGMHWHVHVRGYLTNGQEALEAGATGAWRNARERYAHKAGGGSHAFVVVKLEHQGEGFSYTYDGLDELRNALASATGVNREKMDSNTTAWSKE